MIPVPEFALSLLFGKELVSEVLLSSQRVEPHALTSAGFTFQHSTIEQALRAALTTPTAVRFTEEVTR